MDMLSNGLCPWNAGGPLDSRAKTVVAAVGPE